MLDQDTVPADLATLQPVDDGFVVAHQRAERVPSVAAPVMWAIVPVDAGSDEVKRQEGDTARQDRTPDEREKSE